MNGLIERNASQKSVICIKFKIQLVEKCKTKFVKKSCIQLYFDLQMNNYKVNHWSEGNRKKNNIIPK